jgi:hypothetical protein
MKTFTSLVALLAPLAPLALLVLPASVGCGVAVQPLEGFDVTLTPTTDCTLTGATSQNCIDPIILAQQKTRGRWIFEHSVDDAFTVTLEDGVTVAGILFEDDGIVLDEAPCEGLGGLCYFGRRRFESTDDRNNGCTAFGELVLILLRGEDGTFRGITASTEGTDQDCGTSTVVQTRADVVGTRVEEPAQPRADVEAQQ